MAEQENHVSTEKILFYNLWLPMIIYMASVTSYIVSIWVANPYGIYLPALIIITGTILFGSVFLFWLFYPIYHLVYFIFTRIFSCNYYGTKQAYSIFLISAITGGVGYGLYSEREVIEQKYRENWEQQEKIIMKKKCQERTYLKQKKECLENIEHLELTEEAKLMLCDECYRKGI